MNRLLAVGIIELSDGAILAMRRSGINCLQDLMIQRDLGFLTSEHFGGDHIKELLDACEKIDGFNNGLRREIVPAEVESFNTSREKNEPLIKSGQSDGLNVNRQPIDDGRRRTRESIMKDLVSIANLETPTSLRKAILKLMIDCSGKSFDRKTIKKILENRYKGTISINSDAIRSNLSTLESHMIIERVNNIGCFRITRYALSEFSKLLSAENYYRESGKIELQRKEELSNFIKRNIGKQIKIRYKSERAGSDKWWRFVKVYDQDDAYLYTADYYSSGARMRYLKEKIKEYKDIDM